MCVVRQRHSGNQYRTLFWVTIRRSKSLLKGMKFTASLTSQLSEEGLRMHDSSRTRVVFYSISSLFLFQFGISFSKMNYSTKHSIEDRGPTKYLAQNEINSEKWNECTKMKCNLYVHLETISSKCWILQKRKVTL